MRIRALAAGFPNSSISRKPPAEEPPAKESPTPGSVDTTELVGFRDAFNNERFYSVTSPPGDDVERCESEDVASGKISDTRYLRFRLYRLGESQFVLVAQYSFGLGNALACESIGRVFLLHRTGDAWRLENAITLRTERHSAIQAVEFLPPVGLTPHILIESDVGGPGVVATSLSIFEIETHEINEVMQIVGRVSNAGSDDGAQLFFHTLNRTRTSREQGARFCFTKTTFAESAHWFQPPRVTTECYLRGTGVEPH